MEHYLQSIAPLRQVLTHMKKLTNILFWVNLSKQALTEHFLPRNIPLKFNGTIGPYFKVSFFFASDHWCYLQLAICLGLFGKCLLKRYHFQDETSWLTWFLVVIVVVNFCLSIFLKFIFFFVKSWDTHTAFLKGEIFHYEITQHSHTISRSLVLCLRFISRTISANTSLTFVRCLALASTKEQPHIWAKAWKKKKENISTHIITVGAQSFTSF